LCVRDNSVAGRGGPRGNKRGEGRYIEEYRGPRKGRHKQGGSEGPTKAAVFIRLNNNRRAGTPLYKGGYGPAPAML